MQHKGTWSPAGKDGRFQMRQHSCDWECGQHGLSEEVEQLVFWGAVLWMRQFRFQAVIALSKWSSSHFILNSVIHNLFVHRP